MFTPDPEQEAELAYLVRLVDRVIEDKRAEFTERVADSLMQSYEDSATSGLNPAEAISRVLKALLDSQCVSPEKIQQVITHLKTH